MPNGHVLFAADKPDTGGPTRLYEFDPAVPLAISLTDVTPPIAQYQNNSVGYSARLLMLPNGQVLLGNGFKRNINWHPAAICLHAGWCTSSGLETNYHQYCRQS